MRLWQLLSAALAMAGAGIGPPAIDDARATGIEEASVFRSYYVDARSYGTRRETEPPRYVRNVGKLGIAGLEDYTWLDIGLDYRLRYEFRDHDLRRPPGTGLDQPVLLRTRLYLGVREAIDPVRFYVELEDANRYNSQFPRDNRDVNQFEPIQAIGELYFEDALGPDRPFSLRGGRMAFEFLDRRLIGRNDWRNTTNTFQGFRVTLGKESNDWQVDLLGLQPLERLLYDVDRPNTAQWFVAAIGNWRRWSDLITLQPYWLVLLQNDSKGGVPRQIQSPALRFYGVVPNSDFDYDVDGVLQFGDSGDQRHRALGLTTEVGYTWMDNAWRPRLSLFYGYGSGDENPNDNVNQRFERFFGFARPWSADDYMEWSNISTPKIRLEARPHERVRMDTGWSAYWLASRTDLWRNANLRDPTGQSGDFMGHEFDIRALIAINPRIAANVGYAHFFTGDFPRNLGKGRDSDFFYVEIAINAFE